MMASSTEKKKVCVVGAGVSGLVSARELRREGHDVTVMEQSSGVGGQWLYDPRTDASDPLGSAGVHSGVYASLRLNSPRDSMSFSDFPFYPKSDGTGDARRYPGHAEFLRYIRDFCDAFGLMDAVMLNTKVLHVGLAPPRTTDDDGLKRWMVRWSRRGDCEGEVVTTEEEFDAVIVASGHYSQPMLPAINGMDKWRRRQLHSHSYRVLDSFHDEVVVVVGLSESGKEIALELRQVAREVHVSVKSMDGGAIVPGMRKALSRHHNLHLHLQIECLCEDGQVTFADGSCVVADSIIYCTGYDYSFPFLDTGGLLTVDDNRVGPLFEHTFPPALAPSLSFVGVPKLVLVPRFFEVQARWVAQVLSARKPLPSSHEMLRSVEEYHRTREMAGVPRRLSHALFFDLEYCDEFGEKRCGFPRLQEWKKEAMRAGVASLVDDTESFRDDYHDSDLVLEGLRSEGWSYCSQTLNVKENGVDMMMASSTKKKKVCVVGSGVSGLVSARELLREGHDVTVMEQSSGVGGQWLYDPRMDASDALGAAGVHSGVYASLRLTSPRDIMGFSDFPFFPSSDGGGDARRYPGHAEFLRFIRDFCDAFGLMDVVRLNTKVIHVGPLAPPHAADAGTKRWTVRCANANSQSQLGRDEGEEVVVVTEEVFDAVVVASGHYSQPRLPTIKAMDRWRRRQLHSHSYRVPDSFHGEVVVLVGFHQSGVDIALELSTVANEVHVSVKSMEGLTPGVSKAVSRHHNLHLHLQIECLCEDGQVMFNDGFCVVADSIIYCTGYDFSFPFLDTGGLVTVDDNRVGPLYEHTFPPALAPSLSFVGVPSQVPTPLFYEVQARWVAQVLSGRRPLPSSEQMMRCTEEYHRAREEAGVPRRLSHAIFFDFEYCDEFGDKTIGFPRPPEWKKELMRAAVARLVDDTESFRDDYRDGDLVLEGLRSEGWYSRPVNNKNGRA